MANPPDYSTKTNEAILAAIEYAEKQVQTLDEWGLPAKAQRWQVVANHLRRAEALSDSLIRRNR